MGKGHLPVGAGVPCAPGRSVCRSFRPVRLAQTPGLGRWNPLPCLAWVLLLAGLATSGCGPGEVEEGSSPPSEELPPQDAVVDDAAAGDSSLFVGGDSTSSILLLQEGGSQTPPIPGDSVSSADLQERLDRLEAENDSLRAAVGALLGFLAPPGRGEAGGSGIGASSRSAEADSAGLANELRAVDARARQVQHWGLRIAVATVFVLFTGLLIRLVIWVLEKLAERNAKRRLFFKRLVPIARISLWFLAILFTSMVILNIQAQGLLAAGAAVGVAVGFAAQDIIKNIFGGLIVLFDQPFQVGDKISVEGTYGEVVSIGLRSTRIVTPDDSLVTVPNSQVVDGQVSNANSGELNCQVVTDLYLPGWVNDAQAKRIAFEAAASSKYVFLNKPIVVLVKDEFRETFLTHLKVKAYVLDPRYEFLFMSDVTERARAGFRKAGLLGPMHGVRAYIDLDRFPETPGSSRGEKEGE